MKIAALTSGGVDSSVALMLLKEQGYDVTAFYLKIWLEDELSFLAECPWEEDLKYVKSICEMADVPLKIVSLQKEYHEKIVSYVIEEIKVGLTPNPDILCNQRIKFGAFFDKIGQEYKCIASGHYAQKETIDCTAYLKKAPDSVKDQTYFLSQLTQKQLQRIIFPIGSYTKAQVRELAQKFNLPNKNRKDSQGICFLGKLKFSEFVKYHVGIKKGEIVDFDTKKILGIHNGFWYYTIGQRQGLGLSGGPWYVVAKDIDKNIVYVSKNYYSEEKLRDKFIISCCNWIVNPPKLKEPLKVKLRHGPQEHDCVILSEDNGKYTVKLTKSDQGIAPGQFAVFYNDSYCLGGGVIVKSLN